MNCPICFEVVAEDRNGFIPYKTRHPLFASCSIQICTSCGSGWVPNPPSSEKLTVYYRDGKAYGGRTLLSFLKRPNLTLERGQALARWHFVRQHFTKSSRFSVCDIGAGYGCTYEIAKREGIDLDFFAFESAPDLCRRIKKMGGAVLGDFFGFQGDVQFDLLWASHILEHYAFPDDFLKKLKRLLKPSGACFVEVPCLDFEFKQDLAPHLLFFSLEGLKKMLARNGFSLLAADSVGPLRNRVPKNRSFGDEWELQKYGGERIWLRAVFTPNN